MLPGKGTTLLDHAALAQGIIIGTLPEESAGFLSTALETGLLKITKT